MRDTTLLIFTDGRHYLEDTLKSLEMMCFEDWLDVIVVDDSTRPEYGQWLHDHEYLSRIGARIMSEPKKRGFSGAIQDGWRYVNQEIPWVFHLEDDFIFNRPVDLEPMKTTLKHNQHLVQLALRRQPVSAEEHHAGGIIERFPHKYRDFASLEHDTAWVEHEMFFTTNPSLYSSALCNTGWPDAPASEERFTYNVLTEDPDARFAFWGARTSKPWVEHIGHVREGTGY